MVVDGSQDFSLFTTMRYTTKDKAHVQKSDVPLLERHIRRLKLAHAHFSDEDSQRWGPWPGNDNLWLIIQSELSKADQGDWRVRVLLHPGPRIGVQVIPAPAGLGRFLHVHIALTYNQLLLAIHRQRNDQRSEDHLSSTRKTIDRKQNQAVRKGSDFTRRPTGGYMMKLAIERVRYDFT